MESTGSNIHILIVDDDQSIRDLIQSYLEAEGFRASTCATGTGVIDRIEKEAFDLIILDIMLPELDGFDICTSIRKNNNHVPIMMLTAKDEEYNRVKGLNLGADDYIIKPFSVYELLARTKAMLRRSNVYHRQKISGSIRINNLEIRPESYTVLRDDEPIPLTATEFKILHLLASNREQVFTKKQIADRVWQESYTDPNTIMVHIRRLRKKLEANPEHPEYILTVWGIGYKFQ